MAILQVIRGEGAGKQFPLMADRTILGRHPNCQVQLQNSVVSRHHAQILESHGTFYIEDLRSRNGTYVNEKRIEDRTELRDKDEVRLCDVVMSFLKYPSTSDSVTRPASIQPGIALGEIVPLSPAVTLDESQMYAAVHRNETMDDFDNGASIRKLSSDQDQRSTVDPAVKLKAILEITQALGRELEVDSVLPKMLSTLFNVFPQAEQAFALLKDPDSGKLRLKASRTRGGDEAESVIVSMTVVRHAMQTKESILSQNISDDSRFKQSHTLSRMRVRSMMCVPLLAQDQDCLGVIQIVTRESSHAFSEEDLDLLESLAIQASMAIENARLHEEQIQRREFERDLEFATQVQLGFLPKSRPNLQGYEFADYYEAALSVGGDYFDYVTMPNKSIAIAIGDVAGKGMPAALLMARLYSSTRFQLLTKPTIEEAVAGLNEEISLSGLGHRFITFLLMVIDPATHQLTLVNAGHLPPLLRSADGTVRDVGREKSSLPLGIVSDQTYESFQIDLKPGDSIIAFTDGVTEAMNSAREIFGHDRLSKLYSTLPGSMTDVIEGIVEHSEAFAGEMTSRDDTCIIGFRRSNV